MKLHHLAEKWGTSPATLSRIENGTQRIPEGLLSIISQEIGVPVAELRPDLAARREKLTAMLAKGPAQ
jgi:transcriptional regulator with XRE-family HTH domain